MIQDKAEDAGGPAPARDGSAVPRIIYPLNFCQSLFHISKYNGCRGILLPGKANFRRNTD